MARRLCCVRSAEVAQVSSLVASLWDAWEPVGLAWVRCSVVCIWCSFWRLGRLLATRSYPLERLGPLQKLGNIIVLLGWSKRRLCDPLDSARRIFAIDDINMALERQQFPRGVVLA